ncbi:MAG: hypothetical protein WCA10_26045 [Terracidiphilus sp.]
MLAFVFGPLGMLYSTVPGCFVMFAVNFFAAIWGRGWMLLVLVDVHCLGGSGRKGIER